MWTSSGGNKVLVVGVKMPGCGICVHLLIQSSWGYVAIYNEQLLVTVLFNVCPNFSLQNFITDQVMVVPFALFNVTTH